MTKSGCVYDEAFDRELRERMFRRFGLTPQNDPFHFGLRLMDCRWDIMHVVARQLEEEGAGQPVKGSPLLREKVAVSGTNLWKRFGDGSLPTKENEDFSQFLFELQQFVLEEVLDLTDADNDSRK